MCVPFIGAATRIVDYVRIAIDPPQFLWCISCSHNSRKQVCAQANSCRPSRKELEGPVDWEQWQGPARTYPLNAARFFGWRSSSDYSEELWPSRALTSTTGSI